jgi:anti-sigma-K factor RskA
MAIMKGDFRPGPDGTMLVNGIHCYDQAAANHAASLGRFFAKRKVTAPKSKDPLVNSLDAAMRADELAKLLDRERERAELEQLDQQIEQWVDPKIGGW